MLPLTLKVKDLIALSILPRLHKLLSLLFLLFIPFQISKHFWPSFAFFYGLRLDYLSPTLYALDILAFLLLLTTPLSRLLSSLRFLSPLLVFFSLSLLFSPFPLPSLIYIVKLTLYLFAIFSLFLSPPFSLLLLFSLCLQLFLSLKQFLFTSSGNFPFYYLGELYLRPLYPGVASTTLFSSPTLRAYGTFSHPNALAGWGLLTVASLFLLSSSSRLKKTALFLLICLLFLTQSRLAFLSLLIFIFTYLPFSFLKLLSFLFLPLIFFISRPLALTTRLALTQASFTIFTHFPVFGTGPNSSLLAYSQLSPPPPLFQPDHFLPTLFLSWFGLSGLIFVFYLIFTYRRYLISSQFFVLLLFLLPLFFDHYLFTLKQPLLALLLFSRLLLVRINTDAKNSHLPSRS